MSAGGCNINGRVLFGTFGGKLGFGIWITQQPGRGRSVTEFCEGGIQIHLDNFHISTVHLAL